MTIYLDAGHGAPDHGGVHEYVYESDFNLSLAKKIQVRVPNCALTRTIDKKMPLSERPRRAILGNAGAFISLHCNSSLKENAKGFEVWQYRENTLSQFVIDSYKYFFPDRVVRGIKTKGFAVLTPLPRNIAGILIEFGFLSNTEERGFLTSHKDSLADMVAMAIKKWRASNDRV